MERVSLTDNLIRKTKTRFLFFTVFGVATVLALSLVSYQYHRSIITHQLAIHELYYNLSQQNALVHEIALHGVELGRSRDPKSAQKIRTELRKDNSRLAGLHRRLQDNIRRTDDAFQNPEMAQTLEELDRNMTQYLVHAQRLADGSVITFASLKADIDYVSAESQNSLSRSFNSIVRKMEKEHRHSLADLDKMGILLISLCLFEVLLVWLLVFRPLYSTILVQHSKLSEAVLEAHSASRSKTEFLANISHEIRTPMASILGYAEILARKGASNPDTLQESVRIINQNASHLMGLVDEILDVSKIEAGKFDIDPVDVDLVQLLNDVYGLLQVKSEEKGIALVFRNDGDIPATVHTDPKRLKQILFNIVGNAVKFTDKGMVEMSVSFQQLPDGENRLNFRVRDTGRGIPRDRVERLFTPFEQADTSVRRRFGGAGLGLVLSRGLARKMHGDITILDTMEDVGTTFLVSIDAGPDSHSALTRDFSAHVVAPRSRSESTPDTLQGRRLLVVDDAKDNSRLFKIFLQGAGAEVEVAVNGEEALEKSQGAPFDLILLDLQMPGKDGFQVLEELRARGYQGPIIALTAHAMKEEWMRSKEAGFNGHVTKPIQSHHLINAIAAYLSRKDQTFAMPDSDDPSILRSIV